VGLVADWPCVGAWHCFTFYVAYAADDAYRPPLRGSAAAAHFASAARAAAGTDRRTDGHGTDMLTASIVSK